MTKQQLANSAVTRYVMSMDLVDLDHISFENNWDAFLRECEEAVKAAKRFLAFEERMRRLEKEREEMIEWGF